MSDLRLNAVGSAAMIMLDQFAQLVRQSQRQIGRLHRRRTGFPREYELGSGGSKYRRCSRFRLAEVQRWRTQERSGEDGRDHPSYCW